MTTQPPLLDEASAVAEASDARRILHSVNQARAEISDLNRHQPD